MKMNTDVYDVAVRLDRPTASNEPRRNLRRWWSVITIFLAAAIFFQAIFAGAMLSGVDWAYTAHKLNAGILIASTLTAGLVSIVTLRRIPQGPKLGLTLLSLATAVFLQTALGELSTHGANLMWVHVPLGVALVGLATQATACARRLGAE